MAEPGLVPAGKTRYLGGEHSMMAIRLINHIDAGARRELNGPFFPWCVSVCACPLYIGGLSLRAP